jgi:hypothetical protein
MMRYKTVLARIGKNVRVAYVQRKCYVSLELVQKEGQIQILTHSICQNVSSHEWKLRVDGKKNVLHLVSAQLLPCGIEENMGSSM